MEDKKYIITLDIAKQLKAQGYNALGFLRDLETLHLEEPDDAEGKAEFLNKRDDLIQSDIGLAIANCFVKNSKDQGIVVIQSILFKAYNDTIKLVDEEIKN